MKLPVFVMAGLLTHGVLLASTLRELPDVHQTVIVVTSEIAATDKMASSSGNLGLIQRRYQDELKDLEGCQFTMSSQGDQAGFDDQTSTDLTAIQRLERDLQNKLQLLTWQLDGIARHKAADPLGLRNAAARLDDRLDVAIQLGGSGDSVAAKSEMQRCVEIWLVLQRFHPDWRPKFVRRRISTCEMQLKNVPPGRQPIPGEAHGL